MQIEIALGYHEKDASPESLLPIRKEKVKLRIPEISNTEAPLAFLVHNLKDCPMEVRLYKNQLYKEARISYYDGRHTKEYALEDIPWERVLRKYSPFGGYASNAEYMARLKVSIREYMIIDGVVYRRCYEPYYHIIYFSRPERKAVIYPEFSDKGRKTMAGYSALDKESAIRDAITLLGRNDIEFSAEEVERLSQGHIEVLMPEACKRNFKSQI